MTWQVSPRNKLSGYYDRIHKVRSAAMGPGDDQTTSSVVWNSPLYTTNMIKYTSAVSSKLLVEGGFSSNIERYNNLYQPGHREAARHAGVGWRRLATTSTTARRPTPHRAPSTAAIPDRYNMQAIGVVRDRLACLQGRVPGFVGPLQPESARERRSLSELCDQRGEGVPAPNTVTLLATPVAWQDRLNANLGIYGQDVMTFKRATITLGGRWEYISEQITGQDAQVGRFANIPAFGDNQMPTWKSFSPRTSIVYDLFGTGKTAVRFGYNRFGVAATTTLASLYDPAAGTMISATRAVDRQERRRHRAGFQPLQLRDRSELRDQLRRAFPLTSASCRWRSPDPNLTRPYVDQFNVGVTHEVRRGVSVSAEWFHNDARNSWERNNVQSTGHLLQRRR